MKIQFIIVGWHFDNFPDLIDGLITLQRDNPETVSIFWSCHKQPSQKVKDNFKFKVFPNLGLEDGAYQQALDYLNLEEDTIVFLMHDDIVVKDWSFIPTCLEQIHRGFAFVGNGMNYATFFDPNEIVRGKRAVEWAKNETRNLFNSAEQILTLRESFICSKVRYLNDIKGFEVIWEEPQPDADGNYHIGGIGNLQQTMLGYKIHKIFGPQAVCYLSNTYQDSEYLYECARGKQ